MLQQKIFIPKLNSLRMKSLKIDKIKISFGHGNKCLMMDLPLDLF